MPDEVSSTTVNAVKTMSDGTVKLSIEKYNELLEKAALKAPVINRTTIQKTTEMLAKEHRAWGTTFMGLGASFLIVGAIRYKASRIAS